MRKQPFFLLTVTFFVCSFATIAKTQPWISSESARFVFFCEPIDSALVPSIQHAAEACVDRTSSLMNYRVLAKTSVFIVSDPMALANLTQVVLPEWGIGFALPSQNQIILKSPRFVNQVIPIEQIVQHEYAHIVLGQKVNRPLPRWFDEGLAVYLSLEGPAFHDDLLLTKAVILNRLIPMAELEHDFPDNTNQARLAYVQSVTAITMISRQIHEAGLQEFLDDFARHPDFERMMLKYMGMEKAMFYRYWEKSVREDFGWSFLLLQSSFLWFFITFLFIGVFIIKHFQAKKRLKELEEIEADEISLTEPEKMPTPISENEL